MTLAVIGDLIVHEHAGTDLVRRKRSSVSWQAEMPQRDYELFGDGICIVIALHARPTPTATFSLNRAQHGGELSVGWIIPGLTARMSAFAERKESRS